MGGLLSSHCFGSLLNHNFVFNYRLLDLKRSAHFRYDFIWTLFICTFLYLHILLSTEYRLSLLSFPLHYIANVLLFINEQRAFSATSPQTGILWGYILICIEFTIFNNAIEQFTIYFSLVHTLVLWAFFLNYFKHQIVFLLPQNHAFLIPTLPYLRMIKRVLWIPIIDDLLWVRLHVITAVSLRLHVWSLVGALGDLICNSWIILWKTGKIIRGHRLFRLHVDWVNFYFFFLDWLHRC